MHLGVYKNPYTPGGGGGWGSGDTLSLGSFRILRLLESLLVDNTCLKHV